MLINEKIKELRTRKGYSQENMAELLGMSVTNYGYIEQGKNKPNLEKLEKIAALLDADIYELLTLGESSVYYLKTNKNKQSTVGFVFNESLPSDYQSLQQENALLKQENSHLKEKIALIEDKIKMLELLAKSNAQ